MNQNAKLSGADFNVQRGALGTTVDELPITAHITDNLSNLGSQAEEIASRLYSLRDRLFGPEMVASGGAGVEKPFDPGSFRGAAQAGLSSLRSTLNSIDRLSTEINNRL